jgi:hypothetical protein
MSASDVVFSMLLSPHQNLRYVSILLKLDEARIQGVYS